MDKCSECKHGHNRPLEDKQLGHKGRFIPNWDCGHPDYEVRKQARQIGFVQNCPYFENRRK